MRRRTLLTGAAMAVAWMAMTTGMAVAQQPADTDAVRAASNAFYEALNTGAEPMLKVYAKAPYDVFVGPGMMETDTEARLSKVETDLEKLRKKPKDMWDKLAAVAPFVSGAMIGVIGIYATSAYNARQLETQALQKDREITVARVQTVEKFFPHLSSTDENVREAALDAIAVLGEQQLALRFAAHFGGRSGAAVLARLANSPDLTVSVPASSALAGLFERLKSVVAIVWSSGAQSTGFFVSSDGLLLVPSFIFNSETTADERITVQLHGVPESFVAELFARDEKAHLALLRVKLGRPVTPVQAWNTEPKLGDQALVLAFVAGGEWVSRSGRIVELEVQADESTGRIVTNIPSAPGFAGAPVIDTSSRLIGMGESRNAAGNSVVIPADAIRAFLRRHNAAANNGMQPTALRAAADAER